MQEHLLQFIWQHRLYITHKPLVTTEGKEIIVIHSGILNKNAGPDFLEAKIKIDNTVWAGNIELHINSSDWITHKHSNDKNYQNIILHVVYKQDKIVEDSNVYFFPTLILGPFISAHLIVNYTKLMCAKKFIPCENNLHQVKTISITTQLERVLHERLEEKTNQIQELLKKHKNDWRTVFYIILARGFGLHINQDIFEQLAINTPLSILLKYKNDEIKITSLLFGQAGMLDDYFDDAYPILLQKEYVYLKKIHSLQNLQSHQWKFLRLRPANFPTIRIAQFAKLILQSSNLFSKIIEAESIKEIEKLFAISLSGFWLTHYTFQEKSIERSKKLGKSFIQNIIINVVIPTLYIFGKMQANQDLCDKALQFLQQLPAEKNNIINQWKSFNIKIENAADTQALLQQTKKYCVFKKCLSCSIGYDVLKK